MFDDFFDAHLQTLPVVGIFRGATPERAVELSRAAADAGVALIEIPVQTPDALPSLQAVLDDRPDGAVIGAGTVTTVAQLDDVVARGAEFVVAPGLHPAVVDACVERGIPILPGVATATEIGAALERGLTWLKAFPAAQLSPGWITAQHGPFPQVQFVATGGIRTSNVAEFLAAGCRGVGVSSAFSTPDEIAALHAAIESSR